MPYRRRRFASVDAPGSVAVAWSRGAALACGGYYHISHSTGSYRMTRGLWTLGRAFAAALRRPQVPRPCLGCSAVAGAAGGRACRGHQRRRHHQADPFAGRAGDGGRRHADAAGRGLASPHSFSLKPSHVRAIDDGRRVHPRVRAPGAVHRQDRAVRCPTACALVTLADAPGVKLIDQRDDRHLRARTSTTTMRAAPDAGAG